MNKGYLSIVLHAHLPYVHHPEYEHFFEENWLFEAMTDCYLPLAALFDRLQLDAVDYRITLSLSPTLLTMWRDPLLQTRYLRHLQMQLELAEQEVARTLLQPDFHALALMYQQLFRTTLNNFRDHYQCDILAAFIKHQQSGKLELITTAATHGFLPLLNISESAVRRQIKIGIDTFKAFTGIQPRGFWLPECAYYPGVEKHLQAEGIEYFYVDTHGILDAKTTDQPPGVYAPLICENGVAAFGRDPASSRQVWSAEQGYPGDADYREYYRDIGFDLDLDYLAPYLQDEDTRVNTGIKYYRVTGSDLAKQTYNPQQARYKAQQHAVDFVRQRQAQIDILSQELATTPIIVAPYDAELFGHWWFEGPLWLEAVLRLLNDSSEGLKTRTCSDYLDLHLGAQSGTPAASSWGENGYSSYWLNESNDWIYPLIHKANDELEKLLADLQGRVVNALQQRAINQALRSLLLAQASDWPFILKSGTTVDYAKKRITDHLARFNYLHDAIRKNRINERYLSALEVMDDIFPDLDFKT
ncbi:1,4-alpha-glucan branching protein domain-containing protein [Methylomonas sp. AM2-LC]|uniref:glycoside hydrolase family 57 protein n=1 Tax=Methylomonas sp. AM2-LC TaxID=3153301 RepID=UPI0032657BB7